MDIQSVFSPFYCEIIANLSKMIFLRLNAIMLPRGIQTYHEVRPCRFDLTSLDLFCLYTGEPFSAEH